MTIEDIALQMTPGIGVKGAVHLLGIFGDARGIFAAAPEELAMKAVLREDIIRNIVHRKGFAAAEKELGYCRRNSIAAIASTDPEFPVLLREIPDYPHVLYLKGNAAALSARCVAMVGTRRATPYGQTMCNRLVEGLAAQVPELCIVSGLAFGIDVAAHRAALAAGYEPSRYWRTRSPASCRHNTRPWRATSSTTAGHWSRSSTRRRGRTARHTWPATGSSQGWVPAAWS